MTLSPSPLSPLHTTSADLIMLGLATHEPNFTIIREEFKPNKPRPCALCGQMGHEIKECQGTAREKQGEVSLSAAPYWQCWLEATPPAVIQTNVLQAVRNTTTNSDDDDPPTFFSDLFTSTTSLQTQCQLLSRSLSSSGSVC